jgi:hypothetical protein
VFDSRGVLQHHVGHLDVLRHPTLLVGGTRLGQAVVDPLNPTDKIQQVSQDSPLTSFQSFQ